MTNRGFFEYDPETKRQSCQWKSPGSPRPKKAARMQKSQVKVMLITFDHQGMGMVHHEYVHEYVPHDQTVNQHFYKEVLTRLMAKIRRKRRELWVSNTWILHHDNAPAHAALSVRQFLATKQVTILDHPPYSPDLAPCDYFLFPKLKGTIKGTRFQRSGGYQVQCDVIFEENHEGGLCRMFPGVEKADGEVH